MVDPYVYLNTEISKNLADIRDEETLSCMEAEYTSMRLAKLVIKESAGRFMFVALCSMYQYIFIESFFMGSGNVAKCS